MGQVITRIALYACLLRESSDAIPRRFDRDCSTEGWFRPVKDADDFANFANLKDLDRQCPWK